jgi:TRAP-type C4-dicarboxylate transport system substrate-binding protein
MMRRRQFLAGIAGTATVWPLAVRAQVSAPITWNLPSAYPSDNFHTENLFAFATDLAEATAGRLALTVHPNASLFPGALTNLMASAK